MQGQQKTWSSPPNAEASTPGALLYTDLTPASPVLLNRQPVLMRETWGSTKGPPPPLPPGSPPLAQLMAAAGSAQNKAPAGELPVTAAGGRAASVGALNAGGDALGPMPAELPQKSPRGRGMAAKGSPAKPTPGRKPKGKGCCLGIATLEQPDGALPPSQGPLSSTPGSSAPTQTAEPCRSPGKPVDHHSAPPSAQPSSAGSGPQAKMAKADAATKALPLAGAAGTGKQPTQRRAVNGPVTQKQNGPSRPSPELEDSSVHQAVEAVQVCCLH
jgi:hypothetical protein